MSSEDEKMRKDRIDQKLKVEKTKLKDYIQSNVGKSVAQEEIKEETTIDNEDSIDNQKTQPVNKTVGSPKNQNNLKVIDRNTSVQTKKINDTTQMTLEHSRMSINEKASPGTPKQNMQTNELTDKIASDIEDSGEHHLMSSKNLQNYAVQVKLGKSLGSSTQRFPMNKNLKVSTLLANQPVRQMDFQLNKVQREKLL